MTVRTGIIMPAVPGASKEVRGYAETVMTQFCCTHARKVKSWARRRAFRVPIVILERSDRAVQPIARVTETRHDIADLVELLVEGSEHDRDLASLGRLPHGFEPLRRPDEADGRRVDRAAGE